MELDLSADAAALTANIVDVPSVSGEENQLAGSIEAALRALPHLSGTGKATASWLAPTWAGPSA